ncbi:TIGR02221 family CRISPR-associated protein [Proteiniphilum propionicum]|jgi:CRISPR-associated Csx2 family protein|uniref:TIGR02221 family CRISPR-associated protein n=1 Tax=Proteiniphilum propionicum TaxID=2829812 RepID=UPI001EECB58D|nr:TIGR02221 family CRISPR-associated protein [Proteiniphilum propionicum]ULB35861.1 TIGR02221 family CRISPR-associated protein [Proteiniphilum propionicum]
MARKVLISFIGTGPLNKNNSAERIYKTAKYKLGENIEETSFLASALGKFLDVDTYFLFGTMKSMWEAVYEKFAEQKRLEIDEAYWLQLSEQCGENANHNSKLDVSLFQKIEIILGNDSKIFPIYYGLNEKEIEENFSIFADAMSYLQDGDEIFLDITHSFRSLPLFATTALSFIKDVADKKISFSGIYYGMLEAGREFGGIVPVVNLSYMSELQNWIKGAYSFNHFGNGYLLAELLREKNKTTSDKLTQFTNVLSMNFIHEIKSQISLLTSLASNTYPLPEQIILPKAFSAFAKRFSNLKKQSEYQFELSVWHKENSNYGLSYLCLVEAIVTYVCEQEGSVATDEIARNSAKDSIYNDSRYSHIKSIHCKANTYRKNSAHLLENVQVNAQKAVTELSILLLEFNKILKSNAY